MIPGEILITVNQYHLFDIYPVDGNGTLSVVAGKSADVSLALRNMGNGDDTVSFDVENRETLNDAGISVETPDTMDILRENQTLVPVDVEVAKGAAPGRYPVAIAVRSDMVEGNGTDAGQTWYNFTVVVRRDWTPTILAGAAVAAVLAAVAFVVVVRRVRNMAHDEESSRKSPYRPRFNPANSPTGNRKPYQGAGKRA